MAHDEKRALILDEQVFKQVECLGIEVIGRLIHHKHVGGLGKKTCQQQTVALASGEDTRRRAGAIRRKKKILEITDHVARTTLNRHGGVSIGDVIGHGFIVVDLIAELVEINNLKFCSQLESAAGRRELAEKKLDERSFACAIGPDDSDLVAACDHS